MNPKQPSRFFACSPWDALPAIAGMRVIKPPHALGLPDRSLPEKSRPVMAERAIEIARELEARPLQKV